MGSPPSSTRKASASAPSSERLSPAPASLNKQRPAQQLALNMWPWGCFLDTDMGPCLAGQRLGPAPRDRKLLPAAPGSGRGPALAPPTPTSSPHPLPPRLQRPAPCPGRNSNHKANILPPAPASEIITKTRRAPFFPPPPPSPMEGPGLCTGEGPLLQTPSLPASGDTSATALPGQEAGPRPPNHGRS